MQQINAEECSVSPCKNSSVDNLLRVKCRSQEQIKAVMENELIEKINNLIKQWNNISHLDKLLLIKIKKEKIYKVNIFERHSC